MYKLALTNFNEIYNPNYQDFAKLIFHIGSSLNDRKDRFDKADLIEQGFCYACNNQLTWEDDEGFDLLDKDRNIKFELKLIGPSWYLELMAPPHFTGFCCPEIVVLYILK